MKRSWIAGLMLLVMGYIVAGCSDVGFNSLPKLECKDRADRTSECKVVENSNRYSFSFRVGEVDILFVDDNSGSMFAEQRKMANAFNSFLSNISDLFYNIAIITTDISASPGNATPRAANGNGAYQDGRLLEFTDEQGNRSGLFSINRDTQNKEALFRGTIQRAEALACDQSGFNAAACPSSDERGIYAVNEALTRGGDFFRDGAHLAVVFLTDENERTDGGNIPGYALEANDLPETLVPKFSNNPNVGIYPTKSVSFHSIIVRPGNGTTRSNDSACLAAQTQSSPNGGWPTYGHYGTQYAALSEPSAALMGLGNIMPGSVGTICAADYGSQLGEISRITRANALVSPKQLECDPDDATIVVQTSPAGYESQVQFSIDSTTRVLSVLNAPIGVEVLFQYDCPRF